MRLFVLLSILLISPALAEQRPDQKDIQQALTKKLLSEIDAGVVCTAQAINAQGEIQKLQDELKALKDKPPQK